MTLLSENWDHRVLALAGEERTKYTAQASTVVRTLALSSLAIAWLMAGGIAVKGASPQDVVIAVLGNPFLRVSSILALLCLAVDLLQYYFGAFSWGRISQALNQVLVNDDYSPDGASPAVSAAWNLLDKWGFANNIVFAGEESAVGEPHPVTVDQFSTPVAEARWYLADPTRRAKLGRVLDRRWSPPWVNKTLSFLFWMKGALCVLSYMLLLLYVFFS